MFRELVIQKVRGLTDDSSDLSAAADFFEVSPKTITEWLNGVGTMPISAAEKVFDLTKWTPKRAESQKVAIALPWYKSTNPVTAFSVMSLIDRTRMAVMLHYGDAFIVHTRNRIADNFLKGGLEWLLTVDDDMVIPFGNGELFRKFTGFNMLPDSVVGVNTVDRLLSHGKTLVGGLYWGRWAHGKPIFAEGNAEGNTISGGLQKTRWVGTGCMLIHRSVFTDIEEKFPDLARDGKGDNGQWFTSSEHDLIDSADDALAVLDDGSASAEARVAQAMKLLRNAKQKAKTHSSLGTGEDVQFCVRAAQAGHQPYVDCGLVCGHIGSHVYGPKKP